MLRLNPTQMVALNTIAGIEDIFGLPFNVPFDNSKVESLIVSLDEKNIVKDSKLTDKGLVIVSLLENYNQSNIHLFMNRSRISLDDNSVTAFIKLENEIEIIRKPK